MTDFGGIDRPATGATNWSFDKPDSATIPRDIHAEATLRRNRSAPRSKELLAAVARLDTEPNALAAREIMEFIAAEYDARGGGVLLGLFSRCYLGPPYVDHMMTVTGQICEHFTRSDPVPGPYANARSLASNPAIEYVEVYGDGAIIPVRTDGKPIV